MGLMVVSPPAEEPLALVDVKAYLRVDLPDDDALIQSLITAARQHAEWYTQRAFVTQTLRLTLDAFPELGTLVLPRPRLQSVSSITYVDAYGVAQTLSGYVVDATAEPGTVKLPSGVSWPDASAITIEYVAGYGAATDIPQALKQAMLLLVSHWYEQRSPVVVGQSATELPFAVGALLDAYRVWGFA